MAESASSAAASASEAGARTKFFCHQCNDEIPNVLSDFTCPVCKGGFIEELHEMETSASSSTGSLDGASGGQPSLNDFIGHILRGLSDPGGAGGRGRGPSMQRTFSEGGSSFNATPRNYGQHRQFSFVVGGPTSNSAGRGAEGAPGQNPNSDQQPPLVEHMLFGFLNDLITGLGGGVPMGAGGAPVISNLGDYAWGPGGLDAIVTELMNSMEGTGPPPLTTDKIDNLLDVKISAEQVEQKLQCSVCWDLFALDEMVKKLDCEHVYHPDCIIPWLKLHGTCPVCRKDLNGEVQDNKAKEEPEPRFEPLGNSPRGTNDSTSRNSSSRNGSSRPQQAGRIHSTPGNNPVLQSLNQILDPILSGMSSAGSGSTNPAASGNQPNRGRQGGGSSQSQPPGNQRPGPGSGQEFDNMDLDFD